MDIFTVIFLSVWLVIGFQAISWEAALTKTKYGIIGHSLAVFFGLFTLWLAVASLKDDKDRFDLSWCNMTAKKFHKAKKQFYKDAAKYTKKSMKENTIYLRGILNMVDGNSFAFTFVSKPYVRADYNRKFWRSDNPTLTGSKEYHLNSLKKDGYEEFGFKYPFHSIVSIEYESVNLKT